MLMRVDGVPQTAESGREGCYRDPGPFFVARPENGSPATPRNPYIPARARCVARLRAYAELSGNRGQFVSWDTGAARPLDGVRLIFSAEMSDLLNLPVCRKRSFSAYPSSGLSAPVSHQRRRGGVRYPVGHGKMMPLPTMWVRTRKTTITKAVGQFISFASRSRSNELLGISDPLRIRSQPGRIPHASGSV